MNMAQMGVYGQKKERKKKEKQQTKQSKGVLLPLLIYIYIPMAWHGIAIREAKKHAQEGAKPRANLPASTCNNSAIVPPCAQFGSFG